MNWDEYKGIVAFIFITMAIVTSMVFIIIKTW